MGLQYLRECSVSRRRKQKGRRVGVGGQVGAGASGRPLARAADAARAPLWPGLLAGLVSGLLVAASYPGLSLWPLAIVGWVPLLAVVRWRAPSVRRAALYGLVGGGTLHTVVFYWIAGTMEDMSGLPGPVAAVVLVVYGLLMGVHQAVWFGLLAAVGRRDERGDRSSWLRWLWPLQAAGIYLAVEVVIPFQFPWYLGNALYVAPAWLQAADVIGVVGVSGLCVLVAALGVQAAGSRPWQRALAPAGVALVIALAWWGYGQARLGAHDTAPVKKSWTAAIVQPNPSLAEKQSLTPKPRLPMYHRAERLTRSLDLGKVDALIWPEGSLPFFYVPLPGDPEALGLAAKAMRAPPVLLRITREARALGKEFGKPFVFGALRRTDPRWKERARNAAVILLPGERPQFYDKQLLVPFGEYMPGRDLIPGLAKAIPGVSDMDPGEGEAVFDLGGARVALTICYEALFPSFVWRTAGEADVLLNLTDDVWFGPTNAPELHLMVQVARAVELRRPLVRATATGISALVDAAGRIKMRTGVWTEDARIVTAEVRELHSPFRLWGMWPMWGLVGLIVLWLGWRGWLWRRSLSR